MKTQQQRNTYQREWSKRNRDKTRASKRRWLEKNRELNAARRREYRRLNREKVKTLKLRWERENPDRVAAARALRGVRKTTAMLASDLRCRYNVTIDEYLSLLASQGARCAICGVTESVGRSKRLHLDHDHKTGTVRGLLCMRCNSALGYCLDSPKLLRRAALYLEQGNAKQGIDSDSGFQPVLALIPEAPRKTRSVESVDATSAVA